jgi:hypothetical protein
MKIPVQMGTVGGVPVVGDFSESAKPVAVKLSANYEQSRDIHSHCTSVGVGPRVCAGVEQSFPAFEARALIAAGAATLVLSHMSISIVDAAGNKGELRIADLMDAIAEEIVADATREVIKQLEEVIATATVVAADERERRLREVARLGQGNLEIVQ